jgi:precorrin-8X/cobalt-precorrin-8 methylmutase
LEHKLCKMLPEEIENKSFEIITKELGGRVFPPILEPIIKRVIHTTADFEYVDKLYFSENVAELAIETLKQGASIITDTNMAKAGINKKALESLSCKVECFMAYPNIALAAKENQSTRAAAAVDHAASLEGNLIFAVGNAPTALIRLYELILEGKLAPKLIIGVPVGFVNVVESKELIMETKIPCIIARGRKGGSNVAAAICNALLYEAAGRVI